VDDLSGYLPGPRHLTGDRDFAAQRYAPMPPTEHTVPPGATTSVSLTYAELLLVTQALRWHASVLENPILPQSEAIARLSKTPETTEPPKRWERPKDHTTNRFDLVVSAAAAVHSRNRGLDQDIRINRIRSAAEEDGQQGIILQPVLPAPTQVIYSDAHSDEVGR
jgi:hypothetical protein